MASKRVLIIEDEKEIVRLLKYNLEKESYETLSASDGEAGLAQARQSKPDLIILDLMLPKIDGMTVCRTLRQESQVPILMLTAKKEELDRVLGLELGADDYLAKPFDFVELTARVKSILRRTRSQDSNTLRVSDLELDLTRRKATRQGKVILLTAKEFALLWLLMRSEGEILPRAIIASKVWDMNFSSDTNVVDSAIRRLRSKLDDPFESKLIHTVRGMGYVLEVRNT